jgi:hypothetical protein
MSTTKLDTSGVFQPLLFQTATRKLMLPPHAVRIRRSGIEFLSPEPFSAWAEMTITLQPPSRGKAVRCTGVVIECNGNRHTGYAVSIAFMNLSPESEEQLSLLAFSQTA